MYIGEIEVILSPKGDFKFHFRLSLNDALVVRISDDTSRIWSTLLHRVLQFLDAASPRLASFSASIDIHYVDLGLRLNNPTSTFPEGERFELPWNFRADCKSQIMDR